MSCGKDYSRRMFLRVMGGALGGAWLTLDLSKVAAAANAAQRAQEEPGEPSTAFLSQAELADVDAIAAQIVPGDSTPGAREAGVALFIDRALATFFGRMAPDFRSQLAAFRLRCQSFKNSFQLAGNLSESFGNGRLGQ